MLFKVFKPILILCSILTFAGIVYSFTDHYEKHIDSDGEDGWIYWEDANIERNIQAQAQVSKYTHWILPCVNVNEYTHGKSKEFSVNKPKQKARGSYSLYVYRKGAICPSYIGKDSRTHEWTGKIWFSSPKEIKTEAKAKVTERWDSDTIRVKVGF